YWPAKPEQSCVIKAGDMRVGKKRCPNGRLTVRPRPSRGRGGPARGLGDRHSERVGEAGVTPIVHVQPVRRDEGVEWQVLGLVPVPHQIEAMKKTDMLPLRGRGDERDHAA